MDRTFKLLGINDDASSCSVCGRQELKSVHWLEHLETGEVFSAGSSCGPRLLRCTSKEFRAFVSAEVTAQEKAAQAWFEARPSVAAYRAALAEENKARTFGLARLNRLQPFIDATRADELEAARLFPLNKKILVS